VGVTMNKLTFALALTIVVGTASGLLTHAVATGTVSVLTLQSQTNRLCGKAAGIRRHVAALLLVRNVPARAVTGSNGLQRPP
jgi:hypothetical protein